MCHNCIQCTICKKTKCRDDFSSTTEVLKRRHRDRVCLDCSHPECTNPSCKTCKVCRDTSCKKKQCKKKPQALRGEAARIMKVICGDCCGEDRTYGVYECDACLFPKCTCGKEMSSTTRMKKLRDREWKRAMTPRTWSCECCPARKRQKNL